MKKLFLFLVFLSGLTFSQQFTITPNGFVDKEDLEKNYIVFNFENKTKDELFKSAKSYLNTLYNNPDHVMTTLENEQIVINAVNPSAVKIKGSAKFDIYYSMTLSFKDNKMKVDFLLKKFYRDIFNQQDTYYIKGPNMGLLGKTGLFDSKDKLVLPEVKEATEKYVNNFVMDIVNNMNTNKKSDW